MAKTAEERFIEAMAEIVNRHHHLLPEVFLEEARAACEAFVDVGCFHDCCDREGLYCDGSDPMTYPPEKVGQWRHDHVACHARIHKALGLDEC